MTRIAHLADRAVLAVEGPAARDFLQGLLTQDVAKLAAGAPLWAGLLSPQGKYLFDMILHDDGPERVLLDTEAARADELLRRLTMYRLRRPVSFARTDRAVLAAWDGDAGQPEDPRLPELGQRWTAETVPELTATADDYDMHRLALGIPDGSRDMAVDRLMWLEANAEELHGVSFTKGCYVGQENTARMHHRDKVRRRLLPVELGAAPGEGREIRAGERVAGELRSFRGGRGIAHLRLEHASGPLTLDGAPLRVVWPSWLPAVASAAPEVV